MARYRLRPARSAAGHKRRRPVIWLAILATPAFSAAVAYYGTLGAMRPASYAVPAAAYTSVSAVTAWLFMIFSLTGGYRTMRGWHLAAGCLFASSAGTLGFGIARGRWHLATPGAVTVAGGIALASGAIAVFQTRRSARQSLAWQIRRPASQRAAQETFEASGRTLNSPSISAEERKVARLNRARAAIARSRGDDAPDGLVTAAEELSQLLEDPPDSWLQLFAAATDLAEAMSVRASKHGDLGGYPQALDILATTARHMPADFGAMALVYERRADYHATMADHRAPAPDAVQHAEAAVANLRAAIDAVTPPMRTLLPDMYARLGVWIARIRDRPEDLAEGIELCRKAIRIAGPMPKARTLGKLALATLLVELAEQAPGGLPPDPSDEQTAAAVRTIRGALAEAGPLLRYVYWHGGPDRRADVLELRARACAMRALLSGTPGDRLRTARAWHAAARAMARDDPRHRVRIGSDWVAWAEAEEEAAWCADAYAYLMSVVPPAVAVRYLADERDRVLADVQSTAEEAGYWLAETGRAGDAAIALELGRAVSLSEVLGREQPGLPAALIRAGREDLLVRYQAALHDYGRAPASFEGLVSASQRAWAAYDAVIREIAAVVDIDLPGALPALGDLASAARDGPLVYLAAAAHGGYAIVVPEHGPPAYRPLPGLARAGVAARAEAFLRGERADPDQVEALLRWLWENGIRELAQELPAGTLATLIPVGQLGLLPVHAAGGPAAAGQPAAEWSYLVDRVRVRYAPNARVLLRSRDRADQAAPAALSLLAVAAPDGDPRRRLPYTVAEVTRVARQWPGSATVTDGAPAAVGNLLPDHTVWHFACHCQVTPDSILDSALLLTGARLSLREILALPSAPRRLAVLSACDTQLSGTQLPDEAMGLPAGLLQAGFAGVVACHWPVLDRHTAALMVRFHELWHGGGLAPHDALAEAQRWLRRAAPADLVSRAGGAPRGSTDEPAAEPSRPRGSGPYAHPYFWAPFALTGQ